MGHSLVLYMLCYTDIEDEHTVEGLFKGGANIRGTQQWFPPKCIENTF